MTETSLSFNARSLPVETLFDPLIQVEVRRQPLFEASSTCGHVNTLTAYSRLEIERRGN